MKKKKNGRQQNIFISTRFLEFSSNLFCIEVCKNDTYFYEDSSTSLLVMGNVFPREKSTWLMRVSQFVLNVLWQRANPRNLVYLQPLWITFKNQFFYHSLHFCKPLFRIHLSDTGTKYIVSSAASCKMVYYSLQLRWTPKVKTQIPFLQGRSWPLTFLMTFADICMRNDRCFLKNETLLQVCCSYL